LRAPQPGYIRRAATIALTIRSGVASGDDKDLRD
jgi:hypothetical protein